MRERVRWLNVLGVEIGLNEVSFVLGEGVIVVFVETDIDRVGSPSSIISFLQSGINISIWNCFYIIPRLLSGEGDEKGRGFFSVL